MQHADDDGHHAATGAAAKDLSEQRRAIWVNSAGRHRHTQQVAEDEAADTAADQARQGIADRAEVEVFQDAADEIATQEDFNTRKGVERVIRYAALN